MCRHEKWMQSALKLSKKSPHKNYKMCAILVKSGSVISIGFNKNSPGSLKCEKHYNQHKGIHAELDAILGLDMEELNGSELYISGRTKAGNLIKSAPCASCQAMLALLPIKSVHYYEKTGEIGRF